MATPTILKSNNRRAKLMRRDTAEILTRIFFAQRSLIISLAGWITRIPRLEDKVTLARMLWEDSVAADTMRERVFELRYPRRDITVDLHTVVTGLFDEARNAPSGEAFVAGVAKVLKPALLDAYRSYYTESDRISDGPSALILRHAVYDLEMQLADLDTLLANMLQANPAAEALADAWGAALQQRLSAIGGTILDSTTDPLGVEIELPGRIPFALPARPARDSRFKNMRFYYPHIIDPDYPSAEGVHLQLRSAIGHLNEAWAAEAAAVTLYSFAGELEWEFIRDVARWTYDEGRHCLMGYHRLLDWGYTPEELPMGDYIYTTAYQQGALYMLSMLHHFETKFIHRGRERIETFATYEDSASQHDYEFDWADETFHAEYGRRWLDVLLARQGTPARDVDDIRAQCHRLLQETIDTATEEEKQTIHTIAAQLLEKAQTKIQ